MGRRDRRREGKEGGIGNERGCEKKKVEKERRNDNE